MDGQVRDENDNVYYRAPRNITRESRDLKDRVLVMTETISLCVTHMNARSAPRNGNPDVIERVYVEHFDVDGVKRSNKRRNGSLVKGIGCVAHDVAHQYTPTLEILSNAFEVGVGYAMHCDSLSNTCRWSHDIQIKNALQQNAGPICSGTSCRGTLTELA